MPDELTAELDELVESAKDVIARRGNSEARFPARWEMIELMLREVHSRYVRVTGDDKNNLAIEVRYKGVLFCINNASRDQMAFLSQIFS